ncbi:hypothetical protein RA167_04980 [Mycetohabitans endofungorum]|uniref:hypothetical protein n=1 Tax=Mycetohabitans endofungorum TaxID=417203 RepID=UPI0030D38B81
MLVEAGLADASRPTSIDSIGPAPAAQLRMLRRDTAGFAQPSVERRVPRLLGPVKPQPSVR